MIADAAFLMKKLLQWAPVEAAAVGVEDRGEDEPAREGPDHGVQDAKGVAGLRRPEVPVLAQVDLLLPRLLAPLVRVVPTPVSLFFLHAAKQALPPARLVFSFRIKLEMRTWEETVLRNPSPP